VTGSITHKIPHEDHARRTHAGGIWAAQNTRVLRSRTSAEGGVVRHVPDAQHLTEHDEASPSRLPLAGAVVDWGKVHEMTVSDPCPTRQSGRGTGKEAHARIPDSWR